MTEIVALPSQRYTVRAVLREGMAPAYRVTDGAEGGEAVLRVVPEADADRVRFGGAFRALAGLGHAGVAAVCDYGRLEDGRPYVTSAWVAGPTLGASPRLPANRVATIMRALAGALDAIHRRGWVHGDLRPEGVRIDAANQPVITSWSRMVPEGQAAGAGGAGGTPFRAPETIGGERVDRRADVYALGALAYALLTGAPPFAAPAPAMLMRAIAHQAPPRVGDRSPDVPASLEALVMRMLAKSPADRPAGMGEVLAALGEEVAAAAEPYLPEGPLAGRKAVLERLEIALAALTAGEATAHAVTGEPGMGKSRLLAAFRHQAQLAEVPVLSAVCPARPAPYGPFRAILRAAVPLARQAGATDLAPLGEALWLIDPALGALIGGVGPAEGPREPEREQALIQEAIATLLGRAAGPHGLALLLDDWQHADEPSKAALAYLVRATQRQGGAAVAVLAAMRPEALPEEAGWTTLPLEGLNAEGFGAWLQELFGLGEPPAGLAEQLHGYAAGCPGVAREALRHLVAAGTIRPAAAGWTLPHALSPAALPDRARGLLASRMTGLSAEAGHLAALAAVVDGPVEAGLAAAVLGIDDEAFYAAVETLLRLGIIELAPAGARLASALLAELIIDALDPATSASWHAAIATWLEAGVPVGEPAPLELAMRVARHRFAGGDDLAALRWGLEAGARCQDLQALEEGDALIDGALARIERLSDDHATRAIRAAVAHRAARARMRRHRLDEAAPLFEQAISLAEGADDPVALAEMLVSRAMFLQLQPGGEARQRSVEAHDRAIEVATAAGALASAVRAQSNLARLHAFAGSADRALAILDRALGHPPEAAPQAHARALALRGHLRAAHRPQLREAGYEDLTEAIARQGRIGDKYGRGYSMSLLADLYLQAGRWREAAEVSERYVALMNELGVADDHTIGLLNHALARLELGELDRALELVRRAVEDAERLGHDVARAAGLAVMAWLEVQLGRFAAALGRMPAATEAVMAAPSYILGLAVPFLAGAWLGLGRPDRALAAAQEAQFQMRGHDHGDAAVANECLLAEIYVEKGQIDLARDFAERAIDGATAHGAKGTLAKAAWVRALTALRAKEPDEARRRAEQAASIAGSLGARRLAALSQWVLGEAGLMQGDPEAAACFQAMQVLADEVGAPLLRAQALDGMARCAPLAAGSVTAIADAQRLVRGMLRELADEDLAVAEGLPALAGVLKRQAAGSAALGLSAETNQAMVERLGRVSTDLQSITAHYGLLIREWIAKSAQLQKLNDLSRDINGSLDLDAVVAAVLEVTLELTSADRAFVLLRTNGRYDDLLVHGARDRHGRVIQDQRFSMSICSRVYGDGEPVAILDGMGPEALATARSVVALNLKTVMCVPLACKGRRLGVIYVDSQAALRTYTLADLDQLMAVAAHASTAIDNAMLFDMLARRTEELESTLGKFRAAEASAGTDVLTGLRNRRAFMATADRELGVARRYKRALSLVLLDVDHFKQFNDTYGHAIGDEVLRAVGRVLSDCARETDLVARLGGEEFVVLCPETSPEAAVIFGERLRETLMGVSLTDADGTPLRQLTASFGICGWTPEDATVDTVLARADKALYAAKQGGRNQVRRWVQELGI